MQQQQNSLPFCGLTLKMYSTGKKSPKFEYQASSTKAKFQCSLTKKLYGLTQVLLWYKTPEVQKYVLAGYNLKWGLKLKEGQPTQFGDGKESEVTIYMVKPFNQQGRVQTPQPDIMDDKLPDAEVDWAKESPTDFNPDMYEQELG